MREACRRDPPHPRRAPRRRPRRHGRRVPASLCRAEGEHRDDRRHAPRAARQDAAARNPARPARRTAPRPLFRRDEVPGEDGAHRPAHPAQGADTGCLPAGLFHPFREFHAAAALPGCRARRTARAGTAGDRAFGHRESQAIPRGVAGKLRGGGRDDARREDRTADVALRLGDVRTARRLGPSDRRFPRSGAKRTYRHVVGYVPRRSVDAERPADGADPAAGGAAGQPNAALRRAALAAGHSPLPR